MVGVLTIETSEGARSLPTLVLKVLSFATDARLTPGSVTDYLPSRTHLRMYIRVMETIKAATRDD